jgi:hypothetical protein
MIDIAKNHGCEIIGSKTRTGNDTGEIFDYRRHGVKKIEFMLDIEEATGGANDTLDVYIETSPCEVQWIDVVRFNRVKGNSGPAQYHAKIVRELSQDEVVSTDPLAQGEVRHIIGIRLQTRWEISGGSFKFRLVAVFSS